MPTELDTMPPPDAEIQRRPARIIRVSDQPALLADGILAGVDIPGQLSPDRQSFMPAEPCAENHYNLPWYIVADFDDLDKINAARLGKLQVLKARIADFQAEAKAIEASIERAANYYADLIPAPPEGGKLRTSKGVYSGISYTNMPEREGEYKLVDRAAAREAGLMRPATGDVPLTQTDLRERKGGPGYQYIAPQPISVSLPKQQGESAV